MFIERLKMSLLSLWNMYTLVATSGSKGMELSHCLMSVESGRGYVWGGGGGSTRNSST